MPEPLTATDATLRGLCAVVFELVARVKDLEDKMAARDAG